jgi:hypothetical protein
MSGEAMFGLWALLCGLVGVFRVAQTSDRESLAWKVERAFTLLAFLVAVVLLGLLIYSKIVS